MRKKKTRAKKRIFFKQLRATSKYACVWSGVMLAKCVYRTYGHFACGAYCIAPSNPYALLLLNSATSSHAFCMRTFCMRSLLHSSVKPVCPFAFELRHEFPCIFPFCKRKFGLENFWKACPYVFSRPSDPP